MQDEIDSLNDTLNEPQFYDPGEKELLIEMRGAEEKVAALNPSLNWVSIDNLWT